MSTNIFWRPPPADPEGKPLSKALKFALARRYWRHDGSLSGDWITLDQDDVAFLEGVAAAGGTEVADDVRTLLDAIERYGAVQVGLFG